MRNFFKLSALASAVLLAGCHSIPDAINYDKVDGNVAYSKAKKSSTWMQDPALRTIYSNVGTTIKKPKAIPKDIRNKEIEIELSTNANMQDLITAISKSMNIPAMAESEEIANVNIYLPYFKGTLGNLLNSISRSKNISFAWEDGVLHLKPSSSYMITLPQDDELMAKIKEEIGIIGASDVTSSVNAGVMFYSASMKNQERIEEYFDRVIENSSLITLQIMVITVNMERERKEGFDWSSFEATLGDIAVLDGSSSDGTDSSVLGEALSIGSSGIDFSIAKNSVDIAGLIDLLSTYGNTKTTQDVSMKTISGKEVVLESNQEIPYVSDIDLSTTDSGVSNSGLETDVAQNGISITFKPYFEAQSNLVSIDIDIALETLLGLVELSAGNDFGTITQPTTQTQSFNNKVRLPVGDTVILGGVTYESIADNRSTLSMLENSNVANQAVDVTDNSLFVVIRPTVVQYKKSADKSNTSIENYKFAPEALPVNSDADREGK